MSVLLVLATGTGEGKGGSSIGPVIPIVVGVIIVIFTFLRRSR